MYDELYTKTFDLAKPWIETANRANRLAVSGLERVAEFQLEALRSYSQLGLERCKAAAEIKGPQDLQAFYVDQVQLAGTLRQKLLDDAKALGDLSAGFKTEVEKLAAETVADWSARVRPAAQA